MNRSDLDRAVTLSTLALRHGRDGDWDAAGDTVADIYDQCGPAGIWVLAIGLADTMVIHQGGANISSDAIAMPAYVTLSGDPLDVDEVPAPERWAGRFIAARAVRDQETCEALVMSLNNDAEFRAAIAALLHITANTLNLIEAPE